MPHSQAYLAWKNEHKQRPSLLARAKESMLQWLVKKSLNILALSKEKREHPEVYEVRQLVEAGEKFVARAKKKLSKNKKLSNSELEALAGTMMAMSFVEVESELFHDKAVELGIEAGHILKSIVQVKES